MKKCVILAATHFFFGVLYVIGTMLMQPEDHGFFLVFLVIFPLATTMTAFYIWTLNSINRTLAILGELGIFSTHPYKFEHRTDTTYFN
jgi:hypothetical protein